MAATAGTPRARALAAALRDARKATGLGLRELARILSMSHALLSLWETGKRVPNMEQVANIVGALRIVPEKREQILELARKVDEPNWLTVGVPGIPAQLAGVIECERASVDITEWAPMVLPGFLQTPDYARNIASSNGMPEYDIESRVMVRAHRRDAIARRRDPVRFSALIGEAAVRDPVGLPAELMVDQLNYLIEMSERTNIHISVVPFNSGWHPGTAGPFILYQFQDSSPVVYFEHYSSGAFIPDDDEIHAYQKAIRLIKNIAMQPSESVKFIANLTEEMEHVNDE